MVRRSMRVTTSEARVVAAEPGRAPLENDDFQAAVVRVLASMALGARQEMTA